MEFQWTAKASGATNMILWFTGIIAALIIVIWFVKNNPFGYLAAVDNLEEDIMQLNQRISNACNTLNYYSKYNPVTEQGFIDFSEEDVCIRKEKSQAFRYIRRCVKLACTLNTTKTFNLANITYIVIQKDENVVISTI